MHQTAAVDALIGLPFNDSDDVIRAAIGEASVPALLMSMVHMTGDLSLFDQLTRPFVLIPMDLQGGMSEADKQTVRDRAFDVVRDYRDRGCPPPFVPSAEQTRVMLDVMSAGQVTEVAGVVVRNVLATPLGGRQDPGRVRISRRAHH